MEEDMISPPEINSIAYLNKKRKPQAELLDTPLPKHVCWGGQTEFSSDLSVEPKKTSISIFPIGVESLPESVSNSYSFPDDADSSMSSCDDTETSLAYPKTHASVGPSTSTACWDDASSQTGLYLMENGSTTKASSKKSESTSISDYGMLLSGNYEDQFLEYENCADKDLEDLLYSNGVDANNYVLSSGRWPVNQEGQEKKKKLTIDKEFEEIFLILTSASKNFDGGAQCAHFTSLLSCIYALIFESQIVIPSWSFLGFILKYNLSWVVVLIEVSKSFTHYEEIKAM